MSIFFAFLFTFFFFRICTYASVLCWKRCEQRIAWNRSAPMIRYTNLPNFKAISWRDFCSKSFWVRYLALCASLYIDNSLIEVLSTLLGIRITSLHKLNIILFFKAVIYNEKYNQILKQEHFLWVQKNNMIFFKIKFFFIITKKSRILFSKEILFIIIFTNYD